MKRTVAIPFSSSTTPHRGLVKSAALGVFRGLRAVQRTASRVPGVLATAAHDVRDAWQEASPNV
jgi:hypothetical protein